MVDGAELPPHPTGEVYVRVEEQNGLPLTCISSLMVTRPPEYNYYGTDYMSSCINAKTLRGETWNGRVFCTIDPMTFPGWAQICVRLRQAGPISTTMERHPIYFQHYLDNTRESDIRTAYVLEFDPAKGEWAESPVSVVQTGAPGADTRGYGGVCYGRIGTAESTRPYSSIGSTGSSSRAGSALESAGRNHSTRGSMAFTPGSSGRIDSPLFSSSDMRPGHQVTDPPSSAGRPGFMETNSRFSSRRAPIPEPASLTSHDGCRGWCRRCGDVTSSSLCPDSPTTTGLEVDISSTLSGNMTSGGIRRSSLSRKTMQQPMSVQELSSTTNKPPRKRASVSFALTQLVLR